MNIIIWYPYCINEFIYVVVTLLWAPNEYHYSVKPYPLIRFCACAPLIMMNLLWSSIFIGTCFGGGAELCSAISSNADQVCVNKMVGVLNQVLYSLY